MKKYIYSIVVIAMISTLVACGGDDDSDSIDDRHKTYTQTVNLSYEGGTQTVYLTKSWRPSDISGIVYNASWLTVRTTNAPQIELTASGNTSKESRSTTVTINAYNGDIIVLNIRQSGKTDTSTPDNTSDGSSDDVHNTTTDNPAYAPRR